jgi:RNA polymerase sigma-70 factor, ECF subfamily
MPGQGSPADAEFERLYRASRDDVYAYVATLMRDRFAAEDVTARTFSPSWSRAGGRGRSVPRRRG